MVKRSIFFVLAEIALGIWGIYSFISVVANNQAGFADMVKVANSPEYKTKESLDLPYFDSNVLMLIRFFDLGINNTAGKFVVDNFMAVGWAVAMPMLFMDISRLARPNVWFPHAVLLPLIGQFYGISISHPITLAYLIGMADRKANQSHRNFKGTKISTLIGIMLTVLIYIGIHMTMMNSTGSAWRDVTYYFLWWPMLAPVFVVGFSLLGLIFGERYKFGNGSRAALTIFYGAVAGFCLTVFIQTCVQMVHSYGPLGSGAFAAIAADLVGNFAQRFLFFDYIIFYLSLWFYVWEKSGIVTALLVGVGSIFLSPGFALAAYGIAREFKNDEDPLKAKYNPMKLLNGDN